MLLRFAIAAALVFAGQEPGKLQFRLVKREVIEERLRQVSGDVAVRAQRLRDAFERAGCSGDALVAQTVNHSRHPNLICTLTGQTDSVVVVGAHFDLAPIGNGAVDNWSGASMLPSLYEATRTSPRRHTFVFVGFTEEERGLLGSEFYVKRLSKEERARIKLMVNLDSLGLSSTKVSLADSHKTWAQLLNGVAKGMGLQLEAVNVQQVGTSDQQPFAERKIPTLAVHSLTQQTLHVLHSPRDNLEAINLDEYWNTYRLIQAFLVVADSRPE